LEENSGDASKCTAHVEAFRASCSSPSVGPRPSSR
jgi:hypothetical protein